MFNISQEKPL